jgi:2-polyprenyl-3-methyl-5-hydroxy-6-metoxy-1,4-benzoquinol methylase
MSHVSTGLRRILEFSIIYDLLMDLLGRKKGVTIYVNEFVKPKPKTKILDVGCGTSYILNLLPNDVDYTGFDLNEKYIADNKLKYPTSTFSVARADTFITNEKYDIVLCNALVHHLDDSDINILFNNIKKFLKPDGRLIILDPVRVEKPHFFAKFLMDNDRGRNIKSEKGYRKIMEENFSKVKTTTTCLSNFPYNHLVSEVSI